MENESEDLERELSLFNPDYQTELISADIPYNLVKVFNIISNEYEMNIIKKNTDKETGNLHIQVRDRYLKTAEILRRTIGVI